MHSQLMSVASLEAMFFEISWAERVVALELRARVRGKRFNWIERPAISPFAFSICQAAADDLSEIVGANTELCGRALDASQVLCESCFSPLAAALETGSTESLKSSFREIIEEEWMWGDLDESWRLRCRDIVIGLYICIAILLIHKPRTTAGTVIAA
ncbi:UNVERIFIED_ORG: hypothetical protein J2W74_001300 [Methylorubrum zatmanii]